MEKKYWENIIENSKKKLTLPYLVGAKKILFPDTDIYSIENLLDEIISTDNGKVYQMYHCPDIGEYVIFYDKYDYLIHGLKISNSDTRKLKMIFGMNMEILGKSFNEIKYELGKRYSDNIFNKKFSFVERKWNLYTAKDREDILSANKDIS